MKQKSLFEEARTADTLPASRKLSNGSRNRLGEEDRPVHEWYRFVLSYPPHLVRDYLAQFDLGRSNLVLDPFCGTGTTLVECKKSGIKSVGIEAHPMSQFASDVKTSWGIPPEDLAAHALQLGKRAAKVFAQQGLRDTPDDFEEASRAPEDIPGLKTLSDEETKLLLKNSISPIPLHKALILRDLIRDSQAVPLVKYELLSLASALVAEIGNIRFGPEVGVTKPKHDAPVVSAWLQRVTAMAADMDRLKKKSRVSSKAKLGDARSILRLLPDNSVDAVITSPPYPNEKDYTRTTRLESVILGFITTKKQLRAFKQGLMRSNTRNVYKADDDDQFITDHSRVTTIADKIEERRIELGKDSGFERLYGRVTKLYFGGMARHLAELRDVLKPGAKLAYVVGDQASYLRVMIRTGSILGEIAESLGYEVLGLDLFRTRLATATGEQLREEVLVLQWPGHG